MPAFERLNEQDFDTVLRTLREVGLPIDGLTPQSMECFIGLRHGEGLSAIAGIERYGIVGLLRSVAVKPKFRDHGVGRKLVDAVEDFARGAGIQHLVLLTTTAGRFFARQGYVPVPREKVPQEVRQSKEFTVSCPATATCLAKHI